MNTEQLLQYADMLLKTALFKTHNIDEAEELVQETYMYVLAAIYGGKAIENPKAYLLSVLNNRFFMSLRKKYRITTVSFEEMTSEPIDNSNGFEEIEKSQEAATVRRELAFLAKIYREVMVRYYMYEHPVEKIANELKIPKGTVLSRLDTGRKKIKKGVESMQSYVKNSYQPEKLTIGINGRTGQNNEPFSCVESLLDQNILILAYEEPVTNQELSNALGTPMAFIEESVEKLINHQLLKKEGAKVYTDFIITTLKNDFKNVEISKAYAKETFETANDIFLAMVKEYKSLEGFKPCSDTWLYILAVLSCRQNYMAVIQEKIAGTKIAFDDYPDRPNFGKWVALGTRYPGDYKYNDERAKYSISGRSGTSDISDTIKHSCEWNTAIGPTHWADFKYTLSHKERAIAIQAIENAVPTPFQAELIPDFVRLGFIKNENGKYVSLIPFITQEEEWRFFETESSYAKKYSEALLEKAVETAKQNLLKYPKRISLLPDYVFSEPLFYHPMAYIYEAAKHGVITLDEGRYYPIMYIVKR